MILLFSTSCLKPNHEKYAKITFHATTTKKYFIFTVEDKFYIENKNSPNNKSHPRLSDAEFEVLQILLKKRNYCTDSSYYPKFEIISRQKKIYDATFAKLIAQNYNAKSLTPVSYYGMCLDE